MRRFPRNFRDDYHGVATPPSENSHSLGFASSGSGANNIIFGPGLQVLEGESGQSPQALPGQQHDVSPPAGVNPQPAASSPFAPPQTALVAPSVPPPSSQQASPSMGSAASMSALSSGLPPVQTPSVTSSAILSGGTSSLLGTLPPTSSGNVSATTIPTSTVSPSSTSGAEMSSTTAPAVALSSSTNAHGASFWTGIALVSIAGVATIITLFAWWLRVPKRTRKRPWESSWEWGRTDDHKFPEDSISSGTSTSWLRSQGSRDIWEPRRSTSTLLSSHGTSTRELQLPAVAAVSSFTHGPYPTVRPLPLELRHTDTSVPGLMQDVGSLHVTNLVPGDILTSGDESSRPPTALGDVGTPRESSLMSKPRYLSLNGSGLDVPWIQTPTAEPMLRPQQEPEPEPKIGVGGTAPLNHDRWKERLERSSVKPAESQGPPPLPPTPQPQLSSTIEAWRDSLRNNIASALGVFSTTVAPAPSSRPSVYAYDWNHAVSRAPSTASTTLKPWTLEETRDGAGIVHIRGVPDPTSSSIISLSRSSDSGGSRAPLPPTPSGRSRRLPSPPAPRASLVPPLLPHLPAMPEVPRSRTARTTSTKGQHGSRRRASVRRSSSSASEATSVGSDMSRASRSTAVARWARLSEKEEAARRALRQRRLRSSRSVQKRTQSGLMVQ